MNEKFEFHEEIAYAFCPYCRGRIQALKEVENEEGEKELIDDANKRLEVTQEHFKRCTQDKPYTDDPYATYPNQ